MQVTVELREITWNYVIYSIYFHYFLTLYKPFNFLYNQNVSSHKIRRSSASRFTNFVFSSSPKLVRSLLPPYVALFFRLSNRGQHVAASPYLSGLLIWKLPRSNGEKHDRHQDNPCRGRYSNQESFKYTSKWLRAWQIVL